MCALCGSGFGEREKLQHVRACSERYLCHVNELWDSQATDCLVALIETVVMVSGVTMSRLSPPLHPRTVGTSTEANALPLSPIVRFQQEREGGLPVHLGWMYPGAGSFAPPVRSAFFMTRRFRPVTMTVNDKEIQVEPKKKDKSMQTSIMELQLMQPLFEEDRVRSEATPMQ